jgi:hypothetical protein
MTAEGDGSCLSCVEIAIEQACRFMAHGNLDTFRQRRQHCCIRGSRWTRCWVQEPTRFVWRRASRSLQYAAATTDEEEVLVSVNAALGVVCAALMDVEVVSPPIDSLLNDLWAAENTSQGCGRCQVKFNV